MTYWQIFERTIVVWKHPILKKNKSIEPEVKSSYVRYGYYCVSLFNIKIEHLWNLQEFCKVWKQDEIYSKSHRILYWKWRGKIFCILLVASNNYSVYTFSLELVIFDVNRNSFLANVHYRHGTVNAYATVTEGKTI